MFDFLDCLLTCLYVRLSEKRDGQTFRHDAMTLPLQMICIGILAQIFACRFLRARL